ARADRLTLTELEALHLVAVTDPVAVARPDVTERAARLAGEMQLALGSEFAQHITAVAAGDAELADSLLGRLAGHGRWLPAFGAAPPTLSPREHAIALLVATGLTTPAIADRLVVSTRTVESHLGRVYTKLGVNRRTQVAGALRRSAPPATGPRRAVSGVAGG